MIIYKLFYLGIAAAAFYCAIAYLMCSVLPKSANRPSIGIMGAAVAFAAGVIYGLALGL